MQLDANYRIVRDAHSWNLVYLKNPNKTQYHPNLKQALLAYLHLSLTPPITVQHLLKAISETEQRIEDMLAESCFEGAAKPKGKGGEVKNG
ncbi:MAG: hypothetical protein KF831_02110 [Acidobacteria bacterium]|nr:hypothetical protein [Acidobacteriota bacterium]